MAKVERDANGLTASERRQQDQKKRVVAVQDNRHAARMAEANPACRIQSGAQDYRPVDIAFNIACRKYEREYQW